MAIKVSGTTIIDDSRNIVNAGVVTATSFSGDGSGLTGVGVGASDNVNTTGIITASSFVGNLTGNATGLTGNPDVTVGVLTATTISTGGTTGTAGQVLQSTGTGVTWATAAGGISISDSNVIGYNSVGIRSDSANGRLAVFGTGNFQVFTSPGTYVVNPGISSIRVRVIGAGGNGGSGSAPTAGSGGGGGGYAHKVITSFSAPRTYTVTVGTAPGGTSSFGSEVSATGGGSAGGAGGTGSNGDVNFTGATGASGTPGSLVGGQGGAAGTQKGNGSGASVPGLPAINIQASLTGNSATSGVFRDININRFPFDIFNGMNGAPTPAAAVLSGPGASPNAIIKSGVNGGSGTPGGTFSPNSNYNYDGGPGGTGAGGGGGYKDTVPFNGQNIFGNGGDGGIGGGGGGGAGGGGGTPAGPSNGGSGGPGIVIVEW